MPKKLQGLPRQTIWFDKRRRLYIPPYMADKLGLEPESFVEVELYPNDTPKVLLVRKQ